MSVASRSQHIYMAKINERHVLRVIMDRGPSSRAEVVRYSGLSAPTVSRAAASLQQAGLLEETEAIGPVIGRPAMKLRLATARAQVLGIVIDVNRCWVVATGLDGELREERSHRIETLADYDELMAALVKYACLDGKPRREDARRWSDGARLDRRPAWPGNPLSQCSRYRRTLTVARPGRTTRY